MQRIKVLIIISAGFLIFAIGTPPTLAQQGESLSDVMEQYERKILISIDNNDFLQSMKVIADYEVYLLNQYNSPTFELDLFQSEADHLTFHSYFTDWSPVEMEDKESLEMLMLGFKIPLVLESKSSEVDRFMVMSYDMSKIGELLDPGNFVFTEKQHLILANMIMANFGVVSDQAFNSIGKHNFLVQEIAQPMGGVPIVAASIKSDRKLFFFFLSTSSRNLEENKNHLFELINSVDFNYKSADVALIDPLMKGCSSSNEPEYVFQCVRKLAIAGDYNAATHELLKLRGFLVDLVPQPYIKDNQAYYQAYDIILTNPDPKHWNLSIIENEGSNKMLFLEDKWSVNEEGMGIVVLDLILFYGPQFTQLLADEELIKDRLIGSGRGAALNVGGEIEDEQFTTIKNDLAYQATFSTNIPNIKGKLYALMKSECIFIIFILINEKKFQEKVADYEKIVLGDWLVIGK